MKEIEELATIWGVGQDKALKLHSSGFKTVKKLREKQAQGKEIPLTSLQLIGLKYYEDLLEKIPRAEVDEISKLVK